MPIDELHPLAPVNPYSGSKAAADLLCFQYAEAYGLDVIRVRPFNHSGPGQSDSFVISTLARQVAEIEMGLREPLLKVGNLDNKRDFSDVRDVVQAYIAAARKGRPGAVYNVGSGSSHSVRQLLDWLLEASGARAPSSGRRWGKRKALKPCPSHNASAAAAHLGSSDGTGFSLLLLGPGTPAKAGATFAFRHFSYSSLYPSPSPQLRDDTL